MAKDRWAAMELIRVPGSTDLIVQCLQCGWQFTAITGAQAMFAGSDHHCWRSP